MFLSRSLFAASQSNQQQRRMSSERRLRYQWRTAPVEVPERSSTTTDEKRPPLLLVKSFFNLRQMDNDNGEDMSRVMDELSFKPHRIIFIDISPFSHKHPNDTDSSEDGVTKDAVLLGPVSES